LRIAQGVDRVGEDLRIGKQALPNDLAAEDVGQGKE